MREAKARRSLVHRQVSELVHFNVEFQSTFRITITLIQSYTFNTAVITFTTASEADSVTLCDAAILAAYM